ncbi:MAG: septal ring lytic transglycosylase RlpA family protein [Treponema sp.]|nr:septal ring lytic transglycosylase RlpA family protein [Treponema sp.]
MRRIFLVVFLLVFAASGCFAAKLYKSSAIASFYGADFHGKTTSCGEAFNMHDFTCAHKLLPFNTILRVTNLLNGRVVEVRVNDRGPFVVGREIDLSTAAAEKLNMIGAGTVEVKLEIVKMGANTKLSMQTAESAKKIMAKKGEILKNPWEKRTASESETKKTAVAKTDSPAKKEWIIQVGSYSQRENALNTAKKLSKAGFKNIYLQTTSEVVRVVIKNVTAENLEQTELKLQSCGFYDYLKK